MPNWQDAIKARLSRVLGPSRIGPATPLPELRKIYDALSAGFGPLPHDTKFEKAQLGQIKGEWVRVPETRPHRLVLYLHGGGFIAGSPESHRSLIANLCKTAGAAALAVDYRLAPEFPFPAGLRDAVDAYRLLIAKGMSPDSIVIAGDGAGGGLAFATVMAIRNASMPMPAGCVALSPWADMTLSGWSIMQNAESDAVLSWELLFLSARHYLKGSNPADPYASPVFGNLRDFPPIMVHTGSLEILRDDASRLGELAASANVPVSVEVYDGMPHGFQAYPAIAESKVSLARLGHFIRSRVPEPDESDTLDFSKSAKRGR
jgi:monoterpene epsilon-lactone hydrolase